MGLYLSNKFESFNLLYFRKKLYILLPGNLMMNTLIQYSRTLRSSNLIASIVFMLLKCYFSLTIKCMGILQEPLSNFTYLRSELILKSFPFAIRGHKYFTLCLLIFNFLIHCLPFHASYINLFWVKNSLYFFVFYFCCSSPFFFLCCFVTCAYIWFVNKKTDNFPIIIFQTSFINL